VRNRKTGDAIAGFVTGIQPRFVLVAKRGFLL
jgi:hypothetical protein